MPLHTIQFMRSINADTLAGLQDCMLKAMAEGATELAIHLSSDGGSNDQGFAAYHFLRSVRAPLTIHCIGNVESMAIMMFLAADTRLIVPHGKIKVHPMHWGFNAGAVDHDRLREFIASLDFDANRYADIFEERTKGTKKPADVRNALAGDAVLLTAKEAMSAGIATGIADAVLPEASAYRWWV